MVHIFIEASFDDVRLRSAPRCFALHHEKLQRQRSNDFVIISWETVNFRQASVSTLCKVVRL